MKKDHFSEKVFAMGITLLIVGSCIIPSTAQKIPAPYLPSLRDSWLYVGGSGSGNYSSIQDAINASFDNDMIFLYDDLSRYHESIVVNKSIRLLGENKNTTIIVGVIGRDVVYVYD